MCHLVGAVLLVASMAMCYVFSLFSEGACPFMYTSDSGRSPAVWIIIISTLLTLAGCFVYCITPSKRRRSSDDDPATIALTARHD